MGENLSLRAKTKANLRPELKMKVVWNTCEKELGGEMKLNLPMKTTSKAHLKACKSHFILEKFM